MLVLRWQLTQRLENGKAWQLAMFWQCRDLLPWSSEADIFINNKFLIISTGQCFTIYKGQTIDCYEVFHWKINYFTFYSILFLFLNTLWLQMKKFYSSVTITSSSAVLYKSRSCSLILFLYFHVNSKIKMYHPYKTIFCFI